MLRNETAVIGSNEYSFNQDGIATLTKGVEYGRVLIQHEDEEGNPVKDNDTFIEQTAVDSPFDYNFKKEIEKTDFYQKNKDKYEIVSIDGVAINKQLKDTWAEDHNVVSKAPPVHVSSRLSIESSKLFFLKFTTVKRNKY